MVVLIQMLLILSFLLGVHQLYPVVMYHIFNMFGASVWYRYICPYLAFEPFLSLCTTITRQLIKLKICSNPLKIREVFYFRLAP